MKRTLLFSLLVIGLLLAGTHAFSWSGGPGMKGSQGCSPGSTQGMGGEHRQQRQEMQQEKMAIILDLSDDQQQQLQTLRDQHQQEQQALRTEMQTSRDQMRATAKASDADEASIREAVQQHAEVKTRMMIAAAKHRQQMAAVLTVEQQQKFEQLREFNEDNSCGKRGKAKQCNAGDCSSGDCSPNERSGCRGAKGSRS